MKNAEDNQQQIPVEHLTRGLFVDLQLPWNEHPFLFSRFKIRTEKDIAAIKQLGLKEVTVIRDYSDVDIPTAAPEKSDREPPEDQGTRAEVLATLRKEKHERVDRASQYRNRRDNVSHRYQQKAITVRKIARELRTQPANAVREAEGFVHDIASEFETQGDLLTNLVNLSGGDHNLYNHSVNVTILSLMLASAAGWRGEDLRLVGVGALLHDIGKVEIPIQITGKHEPLTRSEVKVLQSHPLLGRQMTAHLHLPGRVLDIIEQHHEFLDGTGYPKGRSGEQIADSVRLVAVANTYDNLCNPPNLAEALTPKAALATMFTRFKNKLDGNLIERFIRTMGIYPPGTVVKLNDGSIGLVVTVDPDASLRPEVLLYNPDIPRDEALIVDLRENLDLAVEGVLSPKEHPSRIYEYLRIEERLGYFVERRP